MAQALDLDPWRNRVRKALVEKDKMALGQLADSTEVGHQSPSSVALVARVLNAIGKPDRAFEILKETLREYPDDFWLHFEAAWASSSFSPPRIDDTIRHYTAALALRPRNPFVLCNLGMPCPVKGSWTKPSPATARPSKSIRNSPSPTTTSATP